MVTARTYLLAILASLLVAMSFEPIGLWFLAPCGYAMYLLLIVKRESTLKQTLLISLIFAFTSNLIILSWSKTFVGVTPWLLLALLQALFFLPIALISQWKRNIALVISTILLMEEVKSRFPFGGFSWTRIAFSQVDSPFAPLISILGPVGLSLATLSISLLFFYRKLMVVLSLFSLMFLSSTLISAPSEVRSLSVRGIQGGVPERGLNFNARAEEVLDRHIEATLSQFRESDDLIAWPENAIDIDPFQSFSVAKKLGAMLAEIETPLLSGAIFDDGKLRNASILFAPDGSAQSIYIKRYLTPFGEYMPLRSIAEKISPHTSRVNDFSAGNRLVTHTVDGVTISSIICYELLNDGMLREAGESSSLLIVQTNSATFSGSSEGMQQMAITRLRAMETGRSVLSISTTGPSAFIDKRGVVISSLDDGEVGTLQSSPSLEDGETISVKFGGLTTSITLLSLLLWSIISLRLQGSGRRAERGMSSSNI